MRSLWEVFCVDRLPTWELQGLIQRHFRSARQPGKRTVVYPGEGDYAIKLTFSAQDRLVGVEAGPSLTATLEASIAKTISDALARTGAKVFRGVLFAAHKLAGSWRYRDSLQIVPVPSGAPQLDCVFGDHPFILEIKIECSKDNLVTNSRANRALHDTELLLAGLVNHSVRRLPQRGLYGHWVRLPDNSTAYLYAGYHCDTPSSPDDFSTAETCAPVLPFHDLYGLQADVPFAVPDELAKLLDVYHALSPRAQAVPEIVLLAQTSQRLIHRILLCGVSGCRDRSRSSLRT